jgi:hypothetical protein
LVVGIGLLILGFFFFYWAINWNYVSMYEESVNVGYPTIVNDFYGFASNYVYPVNFPILEMKPGDYITIGCPSIVSTQPVYIVLLEYGAGTISSPDIVSYQPDFVIYKS